MNINSEKFAKKREVTDQSSEGKEVIPGDPDLSVRDLARPRTPQAVAKLVEIMNEAGNREALKAAKLILQYGHGKPYKMPVPEEEQQNPLNNLTNSELQTLTIKLTRQISSSNNEDNGVVDLDDEEWEELEDLGDVTS